MKPVTNKEITRCKWFVVTQYSTGCVEERAHEFYQFSTRHGTHATAGRPIAPMVWTPARLCYWQHCDLNLCPYQEV